MVKEMEVCSAKWEVTKSLALMECLSVSDSPSLSSLPVNKALENGSLQENNTENSNIKRETESDTAHNKSIAQQMAGNLKKTLKNSVIAKKKNNTTCEVCGRHFRDNHNLNRHFETKHSKFFTCNVCFAVYNTERKLERHLKKHTSSNVCGSGITCSECSRVFRDKHNLRLHNCSKNYKKSACLYPECDQQFYHVTRMLKHVEEEHDSKIDSICLTFESEDLFQRWKEEEELKTFAYFSKRSGTVDSDYGSYRCYVCQANGECINGPRKTAKRWKKGHVRMGKLCPSRMLVKEANGRITVNYISYHSHSRSVKNDKLPVPNSVKTYAKNLLLMGASPQQVRKSVCEGLYGGNSIIPQGGYVISNRYFFDLKKRLDFQSVSSVDGNKEKYDPVFVFKPQGQAVFVGNEELNKLPHSGELFAIGLQTKEQSIMMKQRAHKIVCVTSSQTYDLFGFEILMFIVPDVFGNGYPVAYFLTSHFDEVTLQLLFISLKTRCPNVKVRSVMTDDNTNIFNAMNVAFGNIKHYLCHSYVEKCWKDEISKRCKIYDIGFNETLCALLHEENKAIFKMMSNDFVEKYSLHHSEFVKYFASNFLIRPEVWAMCYRHNSENVPNPIPYTNVSLHCEYVHNKLKMLITKGGTGTSQSVVEVAFLILGIQEDYCLHYKKNLQTGKRVCSATKGKHCSGLSILDSNVSHFSGTWSVKSPYDNLVVYTVTELAYSCMKQKCYERCLETSCENLCRHLYACSCDDRAYLCQHIHKVHSMKLKQSNSMCISSTHIKPVKIEFIVSEVSETVEKNNCITVIKKETESYSGIDVDFISINIDEESERVEIQEKIILSQQDGNLVNGVTKPEKRTEKPMHRKWKNCSRKKPIEYNEICSKPFTIEQKENKDHMQKESETKINALAVTKSQIPLMQIERVKDTDSEIPFIKVKRLHDSGLEKEHINISKVDLKSEEETHQVETKRPKRPRCGSILEAAIEYKKRRLETSVKKCDIKAADPSEDSTLVTSNSKNFKCKHCDGVFRDSFNMQRHVQNKHSDYFPYLCYVCSSMFKTKVRFENHVKKHEEAKTTKSVQCGTCLRMFRDQYNMKQHRCELVRKQSSCIYPECERQFYHIKQMVKHLEEDHEDKIDSSDLHFESKKLFLAWKEEEEAMSLAVFTKRNGSLGSDNVRYSYYVCQAAGESICQRKLSQDRVGNSASNTHRRWKTRVRTGKVCPSRMLVKEKNGKITVKYISYHSHDVKKDYKMYPPLPKYVKELGKQLLLMGVSPKRVRESIQDGVLLNNSNFTQKRYAVKSRFFYDMKKRLEKKGHVFQNEAEKSDLADLRDHWKPKDLTELINNGKSKDFDPLLIYKPQGCVLKGVEELESLPYWNKLFALGFQSKDQTEMMRDGCGKVLCVRTYFDLCADGFQLINLVVPDKYGNGYPVAHFLCNYINEATLTFLFKSLKKQHPHLEVQALITDDDTAVFNAVQTVFGSEVQHYLCHWYVKNCLLEKIEQCVESQDHKVDIPFHLMNILYERDLRRFQILCRNFSDIYSSRCVDFMKYFVDNFVEKPEVWAMCYRHNLDGIMYSEPFSNVNLHCEYLHNHLKSLNLSGKFSQRVAEVTKLLLKVEREYNVIYRKKSHLTVPVHSSSSGRHYSGLEIEDEKVFNVGDTWTVVSRFDKSAKYTVIVLEKNCNRVNCYEKCSEFLCIDLCSHLYICSCEDRADLCEHIHKVHSLRLRLEKPSDEALTREKSNSVHVIVHESTEKDLSFGDRLKVELRPLENLNNCDDKVAYHEIYELDM
ncbi:uncharacterized protein LOC135211233 [Macrobrachium nipponense]|uniref:uncharacterized protein LOC135211233 n=1 Tax=Macrobrachium nipponense TaxID=159736 RepID=UPI0030C8B4F4